MNTSPMINAVATNTTELVLSRHNFQEFVNDYNRLHDNSNNNNVIPATDLPQTLQDEFHRLDRKMRLDISHHRVAHNKFIHRNYCYMFYVWSTLFPLPFDVQSDATSFWQYVGLIYDLSQQQRKRIHAKVSCSFNALSQQIILMITLVSQLQTR